MKKTLLGVIVLGILFLSVQAGLAINLTPGAFGIKYSDNTFTDFNYEDPDFLGGNSTLDYHPLQNPNSISGNVWGIFSMTGVHTLLDGNVENNALSGVAYYNPGSDGKYYFGVYGGLTVARDTGAIPGSIYLTNTAAGSYLKIYEVAAADAGVYDSAYLDGPNVAGQGAFGTFGTDIINAASATLFLDAVYSPGTLAYYDLSYQAGDLEIITLSDSVTGSAEGYLDIIGGSGMNLFLTGVFPVSFPFAPNRADLKVISDLTANVDSLGEWRGDWTNTSQDPITGMATVVPEPTTMVLLGLGLIGLAGVSRKKNVY